MKKLNKTLNTMKKIQIKKIMKNKMKVKKEVIYI